MGGLNTLKRIGPQAAFDADYPPLRGCTVKSGIDTCVVRGRDEGDSQGFLKKIHELLRCLIDGLEVTSQSELFGLTKHSTDEGVQQPPGSTLRPDKRGNRKRC